VIKVQNNTSEAGSFLIKLLKAILHGQNPPSVPLDLNLNRLYKLSAWHSVANMAYYGLIKVRPLLSSNDIHPFLDARNKALVKEARQELEVEMILAALEQSGIKYMPLKGYILKRFYPQPDMRLMADIDILIEADQLKKAHDIMISLGYSAEHIGGNHDVYYKKPVMNVELHRALIPEGVSDLYSYFGNGWNRVKLKTGYCYRYEMSPEDFYIYLLGHMAKHFRGSGIGIRSIMDIWVYKQHYRNQLDWQYINSELTKAGLDGFAASMQSLSEYWFNGKAGNDSDKNLAAFTRTNGTYGTKRNFTINKLITSKKTRDSYNKAKTKYILWILFPNLEHMTILFPFLRKMPAALPFCWIFRGIRTLVFRRSNIKRSLGSAICLTGNDIRKMQNIKRQSGL
jgi:hypothetical protein